MFTLFTFRIRNFLKNVKGDQIIFLQKFHVKPGIENSFSVVQIDSRKLMKQRGAFFKQNNDIDFLYVFVGEAFSFCVSSHSHVLAHEKIGRVTGNTFCRKGISLFLHLDIDQRTIGKSGQQIHNQIAFSVYQPVFTGKSLEDLYLEAQKTGDKAGKPFPMNLRIKEVLKKRVIGERQRFLSLAEIQKELFPAFV